MPRCEFETIRAGYRGAIRELKTTGKLRARRLGSFGLRPWLTDHQAQPEPEPEPMLVYDADERPCLLVSGRTVELWSRWLRERAQEEGP